MEEKERRLKIKKIKKYNEIVSEEQRKTVLNTALMASAAVVGVLAAVSGIVPPDFNDQTLNTLYGGFSIVSSGAGIGGSMYFLKKLMESINKKTLYEKEIDDLNMELDFDEEDKSRGAK